MKNGNVKLNGVFSSALLLFFFTLSISGCSAVRCFVGGESERNKSFYKTVDEFHQEVRWKNVDQALAYVLPASMKEVSQTLNKARSVEKVVDIAADDVNFEDDSRGAVAQVRFRFYRNSSLVLETRQVREYWLFDGFKGEWALDRIVPMGDATVAVEGEGSLVNTGR